MKRKFQIEIIHVPTYDKTANLEEKINDSIVSFEPYLENFSDNYKSDWSTKQVIGRMDDIATFTRTKRTISLDFIVPSSNLAEARGNYKKSKKLASFLYPVYKTIQAQQEKNDVPNLELNTESLKPTVENFYNASKLATSLEASLNLRDEVSIMSAAPILKIRFSNLISNATDSDGLYGYLDGYNFVPTRESGFHLDSQTGEIIPKTFKVQLTFNVIHTDKLGWTIDNRIRSEVDY
jgi:hypothetical protein